MKRGKIRNKGHSDIIVDYSGVRYDKVTPMDIDGFMEFADKQFVFLELKYKDDTMKRGQELALTRLVDAIAESGREAMLIIAVHDVCAADNKEIDAANCKVTRVRVGGKGWRTLSSTYTVKQAIDKFLGIIPEDEF